MYMTLTSLAEKDIDQERVEQKNKNVAGGEEGVGAGGKGRGGARGREGFQLQVGG